MTRHSMHSSPEHYPALLSIALVLGFCGAFWGLVLWGVSVLFAPAPPHDIYALQYVAGADAFNIDHDQTKEDCEYQLTAGHWPRESLRCVVTGRTN